jgi:hypothetical protein
VANGPKSRKYQFRFEDGEVIVCIEGLSMHDGRILKLRIWTNTGRCSSWMKPPQSESGESATAIRRQKAAVHFSLPGARPRAGAKRATTHDVNEHPAIVVGFVGRVRKGHGDDAGRLVSLGVVLRQAVPISLFAGFEQDQVDLQLSAEQLQVASESTFQIVLQMRANDIVTAMERAHKLADSLRRKVRVLFPTASPLCLSFSLHLTSFLSLYPFMPPTRYRCPDGRRNRRKDAGVQHALRHLLSDLHVAL